MATRKSFLKTLAMGSGMLPFVNWESDQLNKKIQKPRVISTWNFGIPANREAWKVLSSEGQAVDAVEQGVCKIEGDPSIETVGYGGRPDRDGFVTLDACIMDQDNNCGSVAFMQHYKHPISVARKVKEDTRWIMLVGEGAEEFAADEGFEKHDLLTEASREEWEKWKEEQDYHPEKPNPAIDNQNHDTIGMIALDEHGNLSGACTTSGLRWKMHGRVADSAIIGAGLFVDNEVGGAVATGVGEEVIRIAGSHAVVENMRLGDDPEMACKKAVQRIVRNNNGDVENIQDGFIALNKAGEFGSYAIKDGFEFAVHDHDGNRLMQSRSLM